MTICLATLCGDKIIIATDKMVTVQFPNIEFERRAPKMKKLNDSCLLLTAGDALISSEVLKHLNPPLDKDMAIHDIANRVNESYIKERLRLVQEQILFPVNLNYKIIKEEQTKLRPEIILNLYQTMNQYLFNFVILVAGVDKTGAHLYLISPPGVCRCVDEAGNWAIGSGGMHAMQTLITSELDKDVSFTKALLISLEAKKRSEKASGVGEQTDMFVITQEETYELSDEEVQQLISLYDKKKKAEKKLLEDEIEGANLTFIERFDTTQ
jgi:20S proteasome alpha/beta subunit